jgi:charged multivesicular body protein 3
MGQGLDVLAGCDGSSVVHEGQTVRGGGSLDLDRDADGGRGRSRGDRDARRKTVEQAREWQRQIRGENRQLERDMGRIRQEEAKLKREITQMANKGQLQSVNTLAKQVVKSRKSIARLEQTRCSLNALNLQLTTAIASASASSAMKRSADMMKEMNRLASVPELQRTMQEMRVEMARAEVVDDMMEEFYEESDDEREIDAEVQKVMDELVLDRSQLMAGAAAGGGMRHAVPSAPVAAPPPAHPHQMIGAGDPFQERMQALQAR